LRFDFRDPTEPIRIPAGAYLKAVVRIAANRLLPVKLSCLISVQSARLRLRFSRAREERMSRFLGRYLPDSADGEQLLKAARLSLAVRRMGADTYAPIWRRSPRWLVRRFRPEGLEHLDEIKRSGSGAVILATGMGMKLWTEPILRQLGYPVRPVQRERVNSQVLLLMRWDGAINEALPYPGEDDSGPHMKMLHDLVRQGEWIRHSGQHPGHANPVKGRLLNFEVECGRGPWLIARLTGAPLVPVVVLMDADLTFRLVVGEPIRVDRAGTPDGAMQTAFQSYLDFIDEHVLPWPWNVTRPSYWEELALES
jgi:lauroyl/myristoyl acyltransferase